ncbi:serine protein kinase RIO [Nanoarchaeota archaeon]
MARITREKFKTMENVFDNFTLRNIFKLQSQGFFEELESPISIGKEANIFTALKKDGSRVILKIYRLETCDFNKMYDYIKMDTRYIGMKKGRRDVIFSWAQREFRNLQKARDAGIKVPTVYNCYHNILVMEFIGDDQPAPKIKDSVPSKKTDIKKFYESVVKYMKKYHKAKMVHGDLSEFNILNLNDKPVFIDMSQASPLDSSNAKELLERDCKNIARFFTKAGLDVEKDELLAQIIK